MEEIELDCRWTQHSSQAAPEHTYSYYEVVLVEQQEGPEASLVFSGDSACSRASVA